MNERHLFVTSGPGCFPTDMLRYDRGRIVGRCDFMGRRAFVVESMHLTKGRWSSFLWGTHTARIVDQRACFVEVQGEFILVSNFEWSELSYEQADKNPLLRCDRVPETP